MENASIARVFGGGGQNSLSSLTGLGTGLQTGDSGKMDPVINMALRLPRY